MDQQIPEIKTKIYKGRKRKYVTNPVTSRALFLDNPKVYEIYPNLRLCVAGQIVKHDAWVINRKTKRRILARNYTATEEYRLQNLEFARPPEWQPVFNISETVLGDGWTSKGYSREALNLHKLEQLPYDVELDNTDDTWKQIVTFSDEKIQMLSEAIMGLRENNQHVQILLKTEPKNRHSTETETQNTRSTKIFNPNSVEQINTHLTTLLNDEGYDDEATIKKFGVLTFPHVVLAGRSKPLSEYKSMADFVKSKNHSLCEIRNSDSNCVYYATALGLMLHNEDPSEFDRFKRNLNKYFKEQQCEEEANKAALENVKAHRHKKKRPREESKKWKNTKALPKRVQQVKDKHLEYKGTTNSEVLDGLGFNDLVSLEHALNIRITLIDGDRLLNCHYRTRSGSYRHLVLYDNQERKGLKQITLFKTEDHVHLVTDLKKLLSGEGICTKCYEVFESHQKHDCSKMKIDNHVKTHSDYIDGDEAKCAQRCENLVVYDVESITDGEKHVPNLLSWSQTILCKRLPKDEDGKYKYEQIACGTDGFQKVERSGTIILNQNGCIDVIDTFVKMLLEEKHFYGARIFAHNGGNYDNRFILQNYFERDVNVDLTIANGRIYKIKCFKNNLNFLDSYMHLAEPLSKMPETWGLKGGMKKGDYPHKFNTMENMDYCGPLPPLTWWNLQMKSRSSRDEIVKWHKSKTTTETDFVWDNLKELREYCEMDVEILRQGLLSYRNLYLEICNVDPLCFTTLSAVVMCNYRTNFMEKNTIKTERKIHNSSVAEHAWLTAEEEKLGYKIERDKSLDCMCGEAEKTLKELGMPKCPNCKDGYLTISKSNTEKNKNRLYFASNCCGTKRQNICSWVDEMLTKGEVKERKRGCKPNNDGKTIFIYESIGKIGKQLLKAVLRKPHLYDLCDSENGKKSKDKFKQAQYKPLLQYYKDLDNDGGCWIGYKKSKKGCPRRQANKLSLQQMKGEIRQAICKHILTDIDMVNCHPRLLEYWCRINAVDCEALSYYIQNRERCLSDLMVVFKFSRDDAKAHLLSYMNGGSPKVNSSLETPVWYNNYIKNCKDIMKRVADARPDSLKMAIKIQTSKGKTNFLGSCLNLLLCEMEDKCLMAMCRACNANGVEVSTLAFDGLMVYTDSIKLEIDDLAQKMSNEINTVFPGLNMQIVEKKMKGYEITEGLEEIQEDGECVMAKKLDYYPEKHFGEEDYEKCKGIMQKRRVNVDAYDAKTNTCYLYQGCNWHGCQKCKAGKQFIDNEERAKATEYNVELLKSNGYSVVQTTSCTDITPKAFRETHINLRDAFDGGRVEVFKTYARVANKHQKIYGLDIVSLYPTVNALDVYPCGTQETYSLKQLEQKYGRCKTESETEFIRRIVTTVGSDGLPIFCGFIKMDMVLNDLDIPTIASKESGKLTFSNGGLCAKSMFSEELKYAFGINHIKKLRVYGAVGYTPVRGPMRKYVETWLRIKTCANGTRTQQECDEFNNTCVEQGLNITISPEECSKNPGLKALAKLNLNSLWGKFGMRDDLPKRKICRSISELIEVLNNPKNIECKVDDWGTTRGDKKWLEVKYKTNSPFEAPNASINVAWAAATTANARVRLHRMLHFLDYSQVIYCDTDSAYFMYDLQNAKHKDPISKHRIEAKQCGIQIGNGLGEWENEVNNVVEFASIGCKMYSYLKDDDDYIVKTKGIMQNCLNMKRMQFSKMKELACGNTEEIKTEGVTFQKVGTCKSLATKPLTRKIQRSVTKRILTDNFGTKPIHYMPPQLRGFAESEEE